jgi:hypothetical protein
VVSVGKVREGRKKVGKYQQQQHKGCGGQINKTQKVNTIDGDEVVFERQY